jgi:hypothetical protein
VIFIKILPDGTPFAPCNDGFTRLPGIILIIQIAGKCKENVYQHFSHQLFFFTGDGVIPPVPVIS